MTSVALRCKSSAVSSAFGTNARYNYSLGWRVREQICPIQRQKNDYQDTHDLRFRSLPICQAQTRRTSHENGKSINIEQRDETQTRKDERIEEQRAMKMSVKKLNGGSCCAARHTRESGQSVKCAAGPRHPQSKPHCARSESRRRHAQPEQLMICFCWSEAFPGKSHRTINDDRSSRPSRQTSLPGGNHRRNRRSAVEVLPGPHAQHRSRAPAPDQCIPPQFPKRRKLSRHRTV